MTVFSSSFLPSDTTSVTIPGGTLSAGQTYSFDLNFDDRITGNDQGIPTTQFYDTHTSGSLSTAAGRFLSFPPGRCCLWASLGLAS